MFSLPKFFWRCCTVITVRTENFFPTWLQERRTYITSTINLQLFITLTPSLHCDIYVLGTPDLQLLDSNYFSQYVAILRRVVTALTINGTGSNHSDNECATPVGNVFRWTLTLLQTVESKRLRKGNYWRPKDLLHIRGLEIGKGA